MELRVFSKEKTTLQHAENTILKYLFPRAKRNRALRNTELENTKIIPTG